MIHQHRRLDVKTNAKRATKMSVNSISIAIDT